MRDKKGKCDHHSKIFNLKSALKFYDDIYSNAGLPDGATEGNGYTMVQYSANGEASDWMLGKHGIYALSPELGTHVK
jgi:hypothetical protein